METTVRQAARGLRSGLVVAEVALSIVLLAGAGLMMRSFFAVENVHVGFDPHHVLVQRLVFPAARANAAESCLSFAGRSRTPRRETGQFRFRPLSRCAHSQQRIDPTVGSRVAPALAA